MQAAVLGVEVSPAFANRNGNLGVIPELRDALPEMLAQGQLGEIVEGDLVLGGNPIGYLFGIEILHPLVRGGNFGSEIIVDDIVFGGIWIGHFGKGRLPAGGAGDQR